MKIDFQEALEKITAEHRDYHPSAYKFLYTVTTPYAERENRAQASHITVEDFYKMIYSEALRNYGPMAYTVFSYWGMKTNQDIACVVQRMVNVGLLMMEKSESQEAFHQFPSIQEVLEQPFIPCHIP